MQMLRIIVGLYTLLIAYRLLGYSILIRLSRLILQQYDEKVPCKNPPAVA